MNIFLKFCLIWGKIDEKLYLFIISCLRILKIFYIALRMDNDNLYNKKDFYVYKTDKFYCFAVAF